MTFIKSVIANLPTRVESKIEVLERHAKLKELSSFLIDTIPSFSELDSTVEKLGDGEYQEVWESISKPEKVEFYSAILLSSWAYNHHNVNPHTLAIWIKKHPKAYSKFEKAKSHATLYRSFSFWKPEVLRDFISSQEIEPKGPVESWAITEKHAVDFMKSYNSNSKALASCVFEKKIPIKNRIASLTHEREALGGPDEGEVLVFGQSVSLDEVISWYTFENGSIKEASFEEIKLISK